MHNTPALDTASYGQRLLPNLIDEIALDDPKRAFVSYAKQGAFAHGYHDVNFSTLAQAINDCSWWLHKHVGRSENFRTLCYVGPQDLRLFILILAAVKTGNKLLPRTPWLDSNQQMALLEALDCDILLEAEESFEESKDIQSKRVMQTIRVPSLQYWLELGQTPAYLFTRTFAQAKDEPFVCVHTSGTTGLPKPVILNHGTFAISDKFPRISAMGRKPLALCAAINKRFFFAFSTHHSAGLLMMTHAVYTGITLVLAPSYPVTAAMTHDTHMHGDVQASMVSPNILNDIYKNVDYLNGLKRLQFLSYGGAAISREVGEKVRSYTYLWTAFGSTEAGIYALERTDPEDWQYFSFSPFMGLEMRPSASNLYELCFVRQDRPDYAQGVFSTFPNLTEYPSEDLYSKHPTNEGLWKYEGRSNDVIGFSNGLNFNPLAMESALLGHRLVNGALVCGTNKPRASLLIEPLDPPKTEGERVKLLEEIWPAVEAANGSNTTSEYSKVLKDLVMFTDADRPMVRTGKATIVRKKTVELYMENIEYAYRMHELAD